MSLKFFSVIFSIFFCIRVRVFQFKVESESDTHTTDVRDDYGCCFLCYFFFYLLLNELEMIFTRESLLCLNKRCILDTILCAFLLGFYCIWFFLHYNVDVVKKNEKSHTGKNITAKFIYFDHHFSNFLKIFHNFSICGTLNTNYHNFLIQFVAFFTFNN